MKCPQCGLVTFDDLPQCPRCKESFALVRPLASASLEGARHVLRDDPEMRLKLRDRLHRARIHRRKQNENPMATGPDPDAPDWFVPETGTNNGAAEIGFDVEPAAAERSKETEIVNFDDLLPDEEIRVGATTADADEEAGIIEASREPEVDDPDFGGEIPGFTDWREELRERLKRIRARREQERVAAEAASAETTQPDAAEDESQSALGEQPAAGEEPPATLDAQPGLPVEPAEPAVGSGVVTPNETPVAAEAAETSAPAPTAGDLIARIVDGASTAGRTGSWHKPSEATVFDAVMDPDADTDDDLRIDREAADADLEAPPTKADDAELDFEALGARTDDVELDFESPETRADDAELGFESPEAPIDDAELDFEVAAANSDNAELDFVVAAANSGDTELDFDLATRPAEADVGGLEIEEIDVSRVHEVAEEPAAAAVVSATERGLPAASGDSGAADDREAPAAIGDPGSPGLEDEASIDLDAEIGDVAVVAPAARGTFSWGAAAPASTEAARLDAAAAPNGHASAAAETEAAGAHASAAAETEAAGAHASAGVETEAAGAHANVAVEAAALDSGTVSVEETDALDAEASADEATDGEAPRAKDGAPELDFDDTAAATVGAAAPQIDVTDDVVDEDKQNLEWDSDSEEPVQEPEKRSSAGPLAERAAAALCDLLVLTAIGAALVGAAASGTELPFRQVLVEETLWLGLTWAIFAIGYSVFLVGSCGQTIGRMVMRLRVVGADQFSVGFDRAALRLAAWVLSALPLLAGMIPALKDPQRRGLHDRLSHTRVVKA